jgi:ssDNA-binding Zn-finger/Zn-ribbon topoisomerase 1
MGRYNSFWGILKCPACHAETKQEIQAQVGLVQWNVFEIGDRIWGLPVESGSSFIAPEEGLEDSSFWAHGIGLCPNCQAFFNARIEIRKVIFERLAVVPSPPESELYEFLDRWGLLAESG